MVTKCLITFFLLFEIFLQVQSTCDNKTVLYEVKATIHRLRNPPANFLWRPTGRRFSGNFYELEDYAVINIYQGNVTDLCENMIRDFPKLESLSLISVNLSRLQPNAFRNVKRLKELSLSVNHLTEIVNGAFSNLPSLEVLYLSGNEIKTIETNAFSELPNLKSIHLDRNRISSVPGNLFHNCPQLTTIDFGFNELTSIDKKSFKDLKPKHKKHLHIILNKNKINSVDPMALDLSNPVVFHIEHNGLSSMDVMSNVFNRVKDHSRLFFNKNEFTCIPNDVVLSMRNALKDVDVRENPLRCQCVERIERLLGEEVSGPGRFYYETNCI